jgi:hypothetical protein
MLVSVNKLWFVVVLAVSASAQAGIGTITEQTNAVPSIQRKAQIITGAKGTGVEMADAIKTTAGKAGITFEDNTRVTVNENSKLVIDDFVYDPKSKTGKLGLNMALGTVRYASGAIAKNDPTKVAVNTPSATISVRGTDFTATVDEMGGSTVILLPSCPNDRLTRNVRDIERTCVTGEITVENDAGRVVLNQPYQATRVLNRSIQPTKPVVLGLAESNINNMLIVSPPTEFDKNKDDRANMFKSALDIDFLKENGLTNALDDQQRQIFQNKLDINALEQNFLGSMFDFMANNLNEKFLEPQDSLLPDYKKSSGITVTRDDPQLTLCRDTGSDKQCVTTPITQNSTIYQTQGNLEFKNRVNTGAGTIITLIQK